MIVTLKGVLTRRGHKGTFQGARSVNILCIYLGNGYKGVKV